MTFESCTGPDSLEPGGGLDIGGQEGDRGLGWAAVARVVLEVGLQTWPRGEEQGDVEGDDGLLRGPGTPVTIPAIPVPGRTWPGCAAGETRSRHGNISLSPCHRQSVKSPLHRAMSAVQVFPITCGS